MARRESDREDLLREATALVERVELSLDAGQKGRSITAGFRANGAVSIFFGADPVYQFTAAGALRRAYCDGLLFKAVRGRLASMHRVRQADEVQLVRRDLTNAENRSFLMRMRSQLSELTAAIEGGTFTVVGQVPVEADVVGRLKAWLTQLDGTRIAATPHAERRRSSTL